MDIKNETEVECIAKGVCANAHTSTIVTTKTCLWGGPCILRVAKRAGSACVPFLQLGRVDALQAAPPALAGFRHRHRSDHGLQPRRRCNAPAPTPICMATNSSAALSGCNNRATAWSLNVCPYRANFCPSSSPRVVGYMEATSIVKRGTWLQIRHKFCHNYLFIVNTKYMNLNDFI